jgi:integrase/recombinase XerD
MMDSILEQSWARRRHRVAPLLKEREQYLSHLLQRGTSKHRVRSVAAYLIHIIRLMKLTTLRRVDLEEIKEAAECWANYRGPYRRRRAGMTAAFCFTNVAKNWVEPCPR